MTAHPPELERRRRRRCCFHRRCDNNRPPLRASSVVFLLAGVGALSTVSRAQETPRWNEDYRIGFTYDPFSSSGPSEWGQVDIDNSELWYYTKDNVGPYGSHPSHDLRITDNECFPRPNRLPDRRKSPINLVRNAGKWCPDTHEMLVRQIDEESDCGPDDVTYEITPYSLKVYFPDDDSECVRPTVDLSAGLPHVFALNWIEVHARSEHTLDGKRYDAEMQMYHLGTEQHEYMTATVSVMMEAKGREDSMEFQWYLDQWQGVYEERERGCGLEPLMMPFMGASSAEARSSSHDKTAAVDETVVRDRKERRTTTTSMTRGGAKSSQTRSSAAEKATTAASSSWNATAHAPPTQTMTQEEIHRMYYGSTLPYSIDAHGKVVQTDEDVQELFETHYRRHLKEGPADEPPHTSTHRDEDEADQPPTAAQDEERRRAQNGNEPTPAPTIEPKCKPDINGYGCEPLGKRRKMFPYNIWPSIWYYKYRGSITYPPCTDIVNWRVLDVPLQISKRQWKHLMFLLNSYRDPDTCVADNGNNSKNGEGGGDGAEGRGGMGSASATLSPTGENYRPIQETHPEQLIWHCDEKDYRPWMYEPDEQ